MIDLIALWIGRIILLLLSLTLIAMLSWFVYFLYDLQLKKWLGLDNLKARKIVFYYLKHEKEIREYIDMKTKNSAGCGKEKQVELIKKMWKELKAGEEYVYNQTRDNLIVGFRSMIDEDIDEIVILKADFPKQIKYGVIKRK